MPVDRVSDLAGLKKTLTVKPKYGKTLGEPPKPIYVFNESVPGFIGIPMRYALDTFKRQYGSAYAEKFTDLTSLGGSFTPPRLPDFDHPNAHPDQKIIVPQVLKALTENRASMLEADTGVGKTVMALYIAGVLGHKTLIVVNKERLKLQWIKEIHTHLGVPYDDIGLIQGDKCQVEKPVCIAMLQTLYRGKYKQQLENQFGLMIADELHNLGADEYSKALGIVNPRYMLGMTATALRRDKKDQVYKFHFGQGDVKAEAEALPIKVSVLRYRRKTEDPSVGDNWGRDRTGKLLCVSRDWRRTEMIADLVVKLAKAGRNLVVFSEYKKHLKAIFQTAIRKGLDPKIAGHFYLGSSNMQIFAKLPSPLSEKAYHDYVMQNSKVIFSTYGMMKEGISINRLDAGIDATPLSSAKQLIGRIRRPHPNKPLPIWFTFRDEDDDTLSRYCDMRIKEYMADSTVELVRYDIRG